MAKKSFILAPVAFLVGLAGLLYWLTKDHSVMILEAEGTIAKQQRDLLVFATVLSMFVIVPVFILTIFIAWRYRASNSRATYSPEWDSNRKLELTWWGIPLAIIFVLSIITWNTSHTLDPYRPITSSYPALKIQVVALQWNWLFIYPEQNIATVNYIRIPEATPVEFKITSDAPMNSFWIPQLGGQMYAMPGMTTTLHLMADKAGTYKGSSANISGSGFSEMRFDAEAVSRSDFERWSSQTQEGMSYLDKAAYERISAPNSNMTKSAYAAVEKGLYDTIVMKYMVPAASDTKLKADNQKEDTHVSH